MKAFYITLLSIGLLAIVGTGVYFFLAQEEDNSASGKESVPPVQSQQPEGAKDKDIKREGASQLEELTGGTKDFLSTFSYEEYDEPIAYQDEELVKQIISDQHAYLNDLTGWGHIDNVDTAYLAKSDEWQKLQDDVERLRTEGFAPSEAVNDMWNAEAFMRIAADSADLNSLRYVHRIFHDMDAEINGAEVDKIWGATRAFGAELETQELYAYIKG
ncbi:hypothetical protein [Terribacillus sp. FSL K6-0262]|uniref:hypothetical protein n=1 Tax=Terribacillus sp. FSL K6-0262 TaxID=2921447 RepID=UPI0030EC89E3